MSLRNRKFLQKLKSIPKPSSSSSSPASDPVISTLPTREQETETTQDLDQGAQFPTDYTPYAKPALQRPDPHTHHSPAPTHTHPSPAPVHPASQLASPVPSMTRPTSTSTSPTTPPPTVTTAPASPAPVTRSQRTRRPNTLFNPGTWDLSGLEEDSPTLTRKQVSDLFLHIAQMLDKGW